MKKAHLLIALALYSSSTLASENWQFQLEPYVMGTSISGDAAIGRVSGVELDVDFSTILENLEMAAMIKGEAIHSSGWGILLDYAFMDLGHKKSSSRDGYLDANLRQGTLEALALHRFKYKHGYIDYLAGIRWWDNDINLTLDPAIIPGSSLIKNTEDWIDAVAGMRWSHKIANNWAFSGRADVGGFGLEADFTTSIELGFAYHISELMTLSMRYRGLWVNYDNEENENTSAHFKYDTVTHGPILGLAFKF